MDRYWIHAKLTLRRRKTTVTPSGIMNCVRRHLLPVIPYRNYTSVFISSAILPVLLLPVGVPDNRRGAIFGFVKEECFECVSPMPLSPLQNKLFMIYSLTTRQAPSPLSPHPFNPPLPNMPEFK
jgi:hypothetical protein